MIPNRTPPQITELSDIESLSMGGALASLQSLDTSGPHPVIMYLTPAHNAAGYVACTLTLTGILMIYFRLEFRERFAVN
jgi:hypothetical protein